ERSTTARLLAERALVRSNLGDYAGSLDDVVTSIEIAETTGDRWSLGRARWVLADLAAYGSIDRWRSLSDDAIDALVAANDRFALAYARVWRAVPHLTRGDISAGRDALDVAADDVAQVDNPSLNTSHLAWRAWAAFHCGELAECSDLIDRALAAPGFRLGTQVAFLQCLRAEAMMLRGVETPDWDRNAATIRRLERRGEVLAAGLHEQWEAAGLLHDDVSGALDVAQRLERELSPSFRVARMIARIVAAWATFARGELDAARRHLELAGETPSLARWPLHAWQLHAVDGLLLAADGRFDASRAATGTARDVASTSGLGIAEVRAIQTQALIAGASGDHTTVAELFGTIGERTAAMGLSGRFAPLSDPYDLVVGAAREVLGSDGFAAAATRGRTGDAQPVTG
ncbi:MAG: hypothetical protein AAFY28_20550, partial [Actinomycetota bacterium]